MNVMNNIRRLQAEAFLNAGFTADEVAKKFGIVPIKKEAEPAPAPKPVARISKKAADRAARLALARAVKAENAAKRLASRRGIIEDAISRGMSYADIVLLIAKKEGGRPIGAACLGQYMRKNGIKGSSNRDRRASASLELDHVCEMLREHFTAAQIAFILGVSRNAVIGRWFRARQAS